MALHFFFQAEDGIRDLYVTGVQTCALPICGPRMNSRRATGAQPQNKHFVQTGNITRRQPPQIFCFLRSEERRVGKECRSRWSAYYEKKKEIDGAEMGRCLTCLREARVV